jgi:micrococcal nuclease
MNVNPGRTLPALLLAVIVAAPACASTGSTDFTGKVIGIADGDTITVLRDRTPVRVRLDGIDAPEAGQDFGTRAKQAASELVFGKTVTVRPTGTDRYGRTVAEVLLPDGRSLDREMVRQGMAWWYREYAPHNQDLARLEANAKAGRVGLWSQPGAVPPWSWRKGEGIPQTSAVVGNLRSLVYHKPTCPSVARMNERNRVSFDSAGAAEQAGYRPGGDCFQRGKGG